MTEVPEGELVDHPDEILRRVKAGEEITLTADGKPVADLVPHREAAHRPRSVGWDEFWSWPKADRGMLRLLREIRAEGAEEWIDPWQRYEAGRCAVTLHQAQGLDALPVDRAVAYAWAHLRAALREAKRKLTGNDMLIAATAIAYGVPVVTQDRDYADVPGWR